MLPNHPSRIDAICCAQFLKSIKRRKQKYIHRWEIVNLTIILSHQLYLDYLARKEGVEGSKSDEEGVTLKSEPVDIPGTQHIQTLPEAQRTQGIESIN